MIWRIGQFPELEHLDAAERRAALSRVRWWVYPVIVLRASGFAVIALVCVGVGMAIVSGGLADPLSTLLSAPLALVAAYFYQINQIRRQMRDEISRLAVRGATSMCLVCSYDLRGSPGLKCPECGERIVGRIEG